MTPLSGYNVLREQDRKKMLDRIGVSSMDELLDFIPDAIRLQRDLDLPEAMSEWELRRHLSELAASNETADSHLCLLGGGVYDHHIPEAVNSLVSRGEFLTAYTPYQPEISQGLLRALSEFQVMVGKLFDMPHVNCSVYDGATALAESAWMAISSTGVHRLLVAESIWPDYRSVLDLYMENRDVTIETLPLDPTSGKLSLEAISKALETPAAAVISQYPNRFGVIEPIKEITQIAHQKNALSIVGCYPNSLGVLRAPGSVGADIVYAEGQPLGLPLAGGGPYVGLIGTRSNLVDYLPGRLVGETQDIKGEPALALIKQEREQHVRRHEATSHICSNQALMALRVAIYLSLVGENGLRRIATLSSQKAHFLCEKLTSLEGVCRLFDGPFFNEFLIEVPVNAEVLVHHLRDCGYFGGIAVEYEEKQALLIAVTETKSRSDLERFVHDFKSALNTLS